ncbi:tryptophan--tRNA ligase [Mesoterricola sediminis]|uniref:Tryptophan--tRNA ligase n=1 Tax=Mesoterricola sediminis TaxID=2927980 RepID=A0AA48KBR8_9BACT|nr:tryptophan--tRNA ligase [Mesoterricola sediminis]BDU76399.1 tryptophan--tRNA ligase [Mesoterricola sediminis]
MEEKFLLNNDDRERESATFLESSRRSQAIWADLPKNPQKYRVLTGERPTGPLHIGHLFGTLSNRVKIQELGATTFIVIADYQVLTDRDSADAVGTNVHEVILDYLAAGLDPENGRTFFFSHSHVPELNQLLLPFMNLVTTAELDRNPTVKEEIRAAGLKQVNALMYTYPIHQAADILFCKGNVVPVGRDQLPHLELTRKIARRFNDRFSPENPVFPVPDALLSDIPLVLGTDGQKMSKSRGNTIMIRMTPEETAKVLKGAKTDADRNITYDPVNRPEVANLLRLISICTGEAPEAVAAAIGDGGGGRLKAALTEALNAYLAPMRERRARHAKDPGYVKDVLRRGVARAREEAVATLEQVRKAMNMDHGLH